jgi:hypothetical protein
MAGGDDTTILGAKYCCHVVKQISVLLVCAIVSTYNFGKYDCFIVNWAFVTVKI